MRRHVLRYILAAAGIAASGWTMAARAEELGHMTAAAELGNAVSALRPIFAAAGPPNFQLAIEAELDNGGTLKISRKLVKNVAAGIVRMPFSERKLFLSDSDREPCKVNGTIMAFFGGLQLASVSGTAECGGTSSDLEGRLVAASALKGELFPLQDGNELSFMAQERGEMFDVFPTPVHHLKVASTLSGVTLNATNAPDVIYLLRADDGPNGAKAPIVIEIYWSAALRWPIQTRMQTGDGKFTLVERNLLSVAGVMPYTLPDGREVSTLDDRTRGGHPPAETDGMAQALSRAAKSDATHGVDGAAQTMAKLVDPEAQPSTGIDPAFESIAPFVTATPAME